MKQDNILILDTEQELVPSRDDLQPTDSDETVKSAEAFRASRKKLLPRCLDAIRSSVGKGSLTSRKAITNIRKLALNVHRLGDTVGAALIRRTYVSLNPQSASDFVADTRDLLRLELAKTKQGQAKHKVSPECKLSQDQIQAEKEKRFLLLCSLQPLAMVKFAAYILPDWTYSNSPDVEVE